MQRIPQSPYWRESAPNTPFPISSVYGTFFASHTHHRNLVLGNSGSDDSSKKIVCLTAWYSKLISKLMLLRSLERQWRKAGYTSEKCLISYHSQRSLRSWASSAAALPGFRTFILVTENKCPAHLSWDCASLSSVALQTTVPAYLLSLCPGKTSYSASLA